MNELESIFDHLSLDRYRVLQVDALSFDDNNIDEEMSKQAERYAHFHALLAVGKRKLDYATNNLESLKARLANELRDSKGKVTAVALENYLNAHPEVLQMQSEYIETEFRYSLLKGLVKALDQRKDMLIQSSANKREETRLYTKN
jgi:hypothetical protein